jgi:AcrR family transcriptional regulator
MGAKNQSSLPLPPWRTPPKQAPVKQPLSQDLIVETALRILDAEGLDAVSMRRVAQELNTGPASLYAHVSNKDELLELVLEKTAGDVRLGDEPDPERWQEQLKDLAREVWRNLTVHRDLAKVSLAMIPTGENALRVAERMLAIMRAGGVSKQAAGWAIDRIFLYIDSDAYEGSLHASKAPEGVDPYEHMGEHLQQIKAYFQQLPPDRFPHTRGMVEELMGGDGDERFEFGLDLIVRGLEAYVEK